MGPIFAENLEQFLSLCRCHDIQSEYIRHYKKSLQETLLDKEHRDTTFTTARLANALYCQDKYQEYKEAESLH